MKPLRPDPLGTILPRRPGRASAPAAFGSTKLGKAHRRVRRTAEMADIEDRDFKYPLVLYMDPGTTDPDLWNMVSSCACECFVIMRWFMIMVSHELDSAHVLKVGVRVSRVFLPHTRMPAQLAAPRPARPSPA